jgi:GTP-binding protein HflX
LKEIVIITGIDVYSKKSDFSTESSLKELEELVISSGGEVFLSVIQKRKAPDNKYYTGKGKLAEILEIVKNNSIDLIVFDDELTATQLRNLEEFLGIRVIDRTNLILDIFAKRAKTREGKIQVELAQLKYMLPRLAGLGKVLSRLGAGIGTRGPGEKMLETDRRHINRRIKYLDIELKKIKNRRKTMIKNRVRNEVPTVSLVGYTNAGKSTLLNVLCKENIYADNMFFATLEPTTRKLRLPGGKNILVTDTVGFIRKLPHDLVESFLSTLEELKLSDLILIVVDISDDNYEEHVEVVYKVFEELQITAPNTITVYNKIDLTDIETENKSNRDGNKPCFISCKSGFGLDKLKQRIESQLK